MITDVKVERPKYKLIGSLDNDKIKFIRMVII